MTETTCFNCGTESDDLYPASDVSSYPGHIRLFCDDCVTFCDDCNESYRYYDDHRDRYCYGCDTYQCDYAEFSYCDECDESRCPECMPCNCNNAHVRPYSYRPSFYRPKGDFTDSVLMGLELEVAGYADSIVDVVHRFDDDESHIYMKQDGSIDGVELVTHPMTLDWSAEYPFDSLVTELYDAGNRAHSTCGLHIHVSRNSFTKGGRHAMAWLMFLYRNEETISDCVARRVSNQWASWELRCGRNRLGTELRRKAVGIERGDRYVAVNCCNDRTYELRFFASTLDPTELRASLEFADATVEYTRRLSAHEALRAHGLSWSAFTTWLVDQGDRYGRLIALCAEH